MQFNIFAVLAQVVVGSRKSCILFCFEAYGGESCRVSYNRRGAKCCTTTLHNGSFVVALMFYPSQDLPDMEHATLLTTESYLQSRSSQSKPWLGFVGAGLGCCLVVALATSSSGTTHLWASAPSVTATRGVSTTTAVQGRPFTLAASSYNAPNDVEFDAAEPPVQMVSTTTPNTLMAPAPIATNLAWLAPVAAVLAGALVYLWSSLRKGKGVYLL